MLEVEGHCTRKKGRDRSVDCMKARDMTRNDVEVERRRVPHTRWTPDAYLIACLHVSMANPTRAGCTCYPSSLPSQTCSSAYDSKLSTWDFWATSRPSHPSFLFDRSHQRRSGAAELPPAPCGVHFIMMYRLTTTFGILEQSRYSSKVLVP